MRRLITALVITGFIALMAAMFQAAVSTPMYSARAGRTCDNCHVTPNNWINPELAKRKCTLSCQGCHVDPAGGGMRTVSGRFFGRATLPMDATSPRPTMDWDRGFGGRRADKRTSYSSDLPEGPYQFSELGEFHKDVNDRWAWGKPSGGDTEFQFFNGRYDQLNANPMLRLGYDVRLATLLAGTALTFPMQVDVPVLFAPWKHLSLFVNSGFRGRSSGYSATFDDQRRAYFREAFVLAHKLPYMGYVKAGRFVPSFGLRLDDHTSAIRRQFELDGALAESRVSGVEIGINPNYPFLMASYFTSVARSREPEQFDIFDADEGTGFAVNGGWRAEGWSLAGSMLMRDRPLNEGGDATVYGVYGAINPWHYWRSLPITYQFEVDFGSFTRASGLESENWAGYHEIDYLWRNGLNLLVAYDWADPDREVIDDEWARIQFGAQFTPRPGITLDWRVRSLMPSSGEGADADLFLQLHLYN